MADRKFLTKILILAYFSSFFVVYVLCDKTAQNNICINVDYSPALFEAFQQHFKKIYSRKAGDIC